MLALTRGRGGTVLANRRWILELKLVGTGVPYSLLLVSSDSEARDESQMAVCFSLARLVSKAIAFRNPFLNINRQIIASRMDGFRFSFLTTKLIAWSRSSAIESVVKSESSFRLYRFETKSSS